MSEEREAYQTEEKKYKTYTSYSGADMMVIVNGDIVGEVMSILWKEDLQSGTYTGYIDSMIFEDEPLIKQALRKTNAQAGTTLHIALGNEFGQKTMIEFVDVMFVDRVGKLDVDTAHLEERYTFTANDMAFAPQDLIPSEDLSEAEFNYEPKGESDGN